MSFSLSASLLAGRYRLEERIAAGGMGEVWRGLDLVLDRPVAVKLLRAEYTDSPEILARFRAEARHAAAVTHPAIAQIYDYGEAGPGEPPFLVMELVDGPPLTRLLARGPLDPAHTLDVVTQAAVGLAAAHAAGLVHRDIKPGNLLIGPEGTVKITDFGIAYAAGSAPLTRTGALIGTPAYLAPERVSGGTATPHSDLYSLGIVAYECLAGAPPFTGIPVEIALAHQNLPLPRLPPTVPRPVAELIGELTAKNPSDRPVSAGQVAARAERLRAVLGDAAANWPNPQEPAAQWHGQDPAPAGRATLAGRDGGTLAGPEGRTLAEADGGTLAGPEGGTLAEADGGTLAGPDGHTLAEMPVAGRADAGGSDQRRSRRNARAAGKGRRPVLVTVAAIAVVAGLVGWLLASGAGPSPAQRHPASRPHPSTAAGRTVAVDGAALVGQPVGVVTRQLRRLGLPFHLGWRYTGRPAPGTVLALRPTGRVPVGTMVYVTVAARPPGHRHGGGKGGRHGQDAQGQGGHGRGDGNGNGQGDGNGNGAGGGNGDGGD
jgi:serine/threonine-protein kinase